MTTICPGMYRTILPRVPGFRESLYREVCLLDQNLPEGWIPRVVYRERACAVLTAPHEEVLCRR
jgi:hypothetical protein